MAEKTGKSALRERAAPPGLPPGVCASGLARMTDSTKASVRVETGDARFATAFVAGRLDAAGVVAVEPGLTRAVQTHDRLALDLSGVPYMASMGLRLLMAAARTLEKRGGRLVVTNPPSEVEAVLAIAGLEKPLRVCAGPAALAKAFA